MFKFSRPRPNSNIVQCRAPQPFSFQPAHVCRFRRLRLVGGYLSCSNTRDTNAPLKNFDTEPPCPYCYEPGPDNRLESVANAHTAADLHVRPWFLDRADLKEPWALRTIK